MRSPVVACECITSLVRAAGREESDDEDEEFRVKAGAMILGVLAMDLRRTVSGGD